MEDTEPGRPSDVVIYHSRKGVAGIALGAVAFVVAGCWLATLWSRVDASLLRGMIGLIAMVFFGICAVYAIVRLAGRSPAVILDGRGVVDRSSAIGAGLIRWEEIESSGLHVFRNQPMLGIVPFDIPGFLNRQPGWKRAAMKANVAMGLAPVNIAQVALAMPLPEIHRMIEDRLRLLRRGA